MTVLDTRFYNLGSSCMHSENIPFSGLEIKFLLTGMCMQLTDKTTWQAQEERIKFYISVRVTFLVVTSGDKRYTAVCTNGTPRLVKYFSDCLGFPCHLTSPVRLRWYRGCVLAFSTQVRGFKPGRSRRIFQGEKILSTTYFGGEVKPSVPCRRFAACRRSLK
jgi:hypothetical protein